MERTDYAIIGGGIVGASIAYHLSKRTEDTITVFEKETIGSGTTARSGANFGWYGDPAQIEMKRYAWELYNEFLRDPYADLKYEFSGTLKVTSSTKQAEQLKQICEGSYDGPTPKLLTGQEVDTVTYLSGSEIERTLFVPQLDTSTIEGAVFRPNWGYMDPVALTHEFAARAEQQGVEFCEQTTVTDIERSEGTVSAVIAGGESVMTSQVICAAGPWNLQMADTIGLDLPVSHTLGPLFRLDASPPSQCTLPSIVNEDSGAFCRPDFDGTYLLGHRPRDPNAPDHYDPDTVIDEVPDGLRDQALDSMAELLPFIADADIVNERVAVRSSVRDNRPIVGWTSIPGFSIAAFDSSGIQLAPAVGDIIAQQLVNGNPTKHYDAVSISRFDGYTDIHTR